MTDIVERLRKPMVVNLSHPIDAERAEAADEIERLRKLVCEHAHVRTLEGEIERLQAELAADLHEEGTREELLREVVRLYDENVRLRAAVVKGKSGYEYISTYDEIVAAERERCAKIAEKWDGTGIGPRFVACDIAAAIRRGDE